ncbi:MAG: MFS transporter [Prevotellaceae bacterium]|jgi:EmrB/QacA subfamily drug resistance transporter|nr:MFS transporter [Prevotellaceae bacterium]
MNKEINKNSALFVLCLASFLVPFMGSAINLSLPQISKTFALGAVSQSWIATSYLIATAILQVPFARLADMFGRRRFFVAGLLLFCISNFLCGFASSGALLIAFRAISGVGCAMIFGTNMAILVSLFPQNKRGKAIGINTAVVYFALASGPFFGGLMTQHFGWQSLFYLVGFLSFIAVIYSYYALKTEWIEAKGEHFDLTGSIIYAVGLFCLIFGFSELPDFWGFILIAFGIFGITGFVFYELKQRQPLFDVRIFSGNKVFSLSSLSALINYACTFAVGFMMSLYLQHIRGFEPQIAGFILISQALVQSVVSLYGGWLSDRINPSLLATLGMLLLVAGLVGLVFITTTTSLVFIIFILVLLGVGFGLFSSPNANVIMNSVDKHYYGQASATMGTMRLTGQAFSMGIATMGLALFVGNRQIVSELFSAFMTSFRVTFIIFAVLCALGAYTSSFRIKSLNKKQC